MEKYEYVLPNNMKVILAPEHGLPIVQAQGWVRAGAALDSRRLVGGAVLRMLNRGTAVHTREQFDDELDKYGLIYEAKASDSSPFFVEWNGRATKRHVGEFLRLVYESLLFPLFSEREFELVKKYWKSEVCSMASDPEALASEEIPRMIFGPLHPSHRLSSGEVLAQLGELMAEDLRSFWDVHYLPGRAGIVLVGDFEPDEMYGLTRCVFGEWDKKAQHRAAINPMFDANDYAKYQDYEERVRFVPGKSSAVLAIGQGISMPSSNHSDYPALLMAIEALGGVPHGRLFQHVRERCGLSYNVGAKLEDMHDAPGYFLTIAHTNPENMPKTQEETWRVITEFCRRGITQEELAQEKIMHRGKRALLSSSRATLAQEIVSGYVAGRSMDEVEKIITGLTLEEVNAVISRYLNPERMKVVRTGTVK